MIAGTPAGDPPATRTAFEILACPLVVISPFRLTRLASTSTKPPRPRLGSRKPVAPRFRLLAVSFTSWGVKAASCGSTGPTLPAIFIAAVRSLHRKLYREIAAHGDVAGRQIDLGVDGTLLGIRVAQGDLAVF